MGSWRRDDRWTLAEIGDDGKDAAILILFVGLWMRTPLHVIEIKERAAVNPAEVRS